MADMGRIIMVVKGEKRNIKQFINMLNPCKSIHIGEGVYIDKIYIKKVDENTYRGLIFGEVKYGVQSALIDEAIKMREITGMWDFDNMDEMNEIIFTLFEACDIFHLDMEVYSECIYYQEHYLFMNGKLLKDEWVESNEYCDEDIDEWITTGGFDEWKFELLNETKLKVG